jgi:hypothetical protein
MMKKIFNPAVWIFVTTAILSGLHSPVLGQSNAIDAENKRVTQTILHLDSLFWKTYNTCDIAHNGLYFTDDIRFYHDKGGITNGKTALVNSIKNNICGNPNQRVRREAVEGTVMVYPMRNGDSVYGAVISGDHYFYISENNQPEKRTGLAKFTHLWLLQNNEWKMSVVLSYDHGPAPYTNKKQEITLPEEELKAFEGNYKNPKFGSFNYRIEGSNLLMDGQGVHSLLYAESKNKFFAKERDLEFEFIRNEKNQPYKIIVYENGAAVDELLRY